MFIEGLSEQTQKNLELLKEVPFVAKYYLAGGSALSLHLGHRYSIDLDFFSPTPENPLIIEGLLAKIGKLEIFQNDAGTFSGRLNGVRLSFFLYSYPNLFPLTDLFGVRVANILDIGCMKLDAVSSRGTKRDFIDLYVICRKAKPLKELLKLFRKKYENVDYSILHILKSLVYFADAEKDEIPQMIERVEWEAVKNFFVREVKKLTYFVVRNFKKD